MGCEMDTLRDARQPGFCLLCWQHPAYLLGTCFPRYLPKVQPIHVHSSQPHHRLSTEWCAGSDVRLEARNCISSSQWLLWYQTLHCHLGLSQLLCKNHGTEGRAVAESVPLWDAGKFLLPKHLRTSDH